MRDLIINHPIKPYEASCQSEQGFVKLIYQNQSAFPMAVERYRGGGREGRHHITRMQKQNCHCCVLHTYITSFHLPVTKNPLEHAQLG